tara:strand:- start:154 stop:453 length:300 start_codon:yes stop_codon:yes gene_type:complete
MQESNKAWEALASPKMSLSAFNQMIALARFKDVPEEERPAEVLRVWKEWARMSNYTESSRSKFLPAQNKWEEMNLRTLITWAVVAIPLTVAAILVFGLN